MLPVKDVGWAEGPVVWGLNFVGFQILQRHYWKLNYFFLCFGCLMLYFPAGLKRLCLPDRSKGTLPLSEMFQVVVRVEKGRHHLPPSLDGTEAEFFPQPEQSLGESSICST